MDNKIKIAIYSRKSKYSDKGDSVGNQVEIAMQYINQYYPKNKYDTEITVFEDEGFSGKNIDRPKFKQFLLEEQINPFDILICYRLDRISRNVADFSNLLSKITKLGTHFVSIKEQFDTKTPMGRAMMYVASVFAQLEREVIAERIKDNMIELAKTGRWLGGITPTGFTSKRIEFVDVYEQNEDNIIEKKKKIATKLVVNNEEKEIVKTIFNKFLELKYLNKLETYFLQNKILTRNNIDFSVTTLRSILTNPVYAPNDKEILRYFNNKNIQIYADGDRLKFDGKYGLITYGKKDGKRQNNMKKWIIAVGLHPPIIDSRKWIRTQELLNKNKDKRYRANYKHSFLFSGILQCSECGSYMRPKVAKAERFYYICELKEKSKRKRCNGKNISGLTLDSLVIQKISQIYVPNLKIYQELEKMPIKKQKNGIQERQNELKKMLRRNEEEINRLVNKLKYIDEEIIDIINNELKKLKEENKKIKNELLDLNNNDNVNKFKPNNVKENKELVLTIINDCFNTFKTLDLKLKKDILKNLIKNMKGNGKNITINLVNTKINKEDKKMLFESLE